MTQDANSILMGSGAPAAKFDHIGAVLTGTVVREPEARQQTDFRTQIPETWKDGSPKMQVIVQLQTSERDPQRPNDDGVRALYIKGKHLTDAIRQAVRQSGADGIHTGGTLTVQYIADGPAEAGLNPPKLYGASYTPPAVSFNGVTAPTPGAPAAPVVQQQPMAMQQPAVVHQAEPAVSPVATAVLGAPPACPPGVDQVMWARMDREQQQRVLAAMGITQPGY